MDIYFWDLWIPAPPISSDWVAHLCLDQKTQEIPGRQKKISGKSKLQSQYYSITPSVRGGGSKMIAYAHSGEGRGCQIFVRNIHILFKGGVQTNSVFLGHCFQGLCRLFTVF